MATIIRIKVFDFMGANLNGAKTRCESRCKPSVGHKVLPLLSLGQINWGVAFSPMPKRISPCRLFRLCGVDNLNFCACSEPIKSMVCAADAGSSRTPALRGGADAHRP